jgi:chemotaxis signal transduction protein
MRVVRGLPFHPVPGSRSHLLGLAQYGGEPLPVLDLHALVAGGRRRTNYRTVVIVGRRHRDTSTLGLAVDEALRVTPLSRVSESRTDGRLHELIVGMAEVDGEAVLIVNSSRLIGVERGQVGGIDG